MIASFRRRLKKKNYTVDGFLKWCRKAFAVVAFIGFWAGVGYGTGKLADLSVRDNDRNNWRKIVFGLTHPELRDWTMAVWGFIAFVEAVFFIKAYYRRVIRPEYDELGFTALHQLCQNSHIAAEDMHRLLGAGRAYEQRVVQAWLAAAAQDRTRSRTALHFLIANINVTPHLMSVLLEANVSVAKIADSAGNLPLHALCRNPGVTPELLELALDAHHNAMEQPNNDDEGEHAETPLELLQQNPTYKYHEEDFVGVKDDHQYVLELEQEHEKSKRAFGWWKPLNLLKHDEQLLPELLDPQLRLEVVRNVHMVLRQLKATYLSAFREEVKLWRCPALGRTTAHEQEPIAGQWPLACHLNALHDLRSAGDAATQLRSVQSQAHVHARKAGSERPIKDSFIQREGGRHFREPSLLLTKLNRTKGRPLDVFARLR